MDWFRLRSHSVQILMLAVSAALAGCSGSSGASSGADAAAPPGEPPANSPADPPSGRDPGDDPNAEPEVSLTANDPVVAAGDTVTLTWSSRNATACTASGGWSGARATSGSAVVGPLAQSTTFSLSCSGTGGNALAMLAVDVFGNVTLQWDPPTENVDGSPLTDLASYRIYYGEFSGTYTSEIAVEDPADTEHELLLPSGSYYFAMTALDTDGNESGYSNEVLKIVN